MDRRTFVMGAAAIGAAALTGGMLGGCAGGEGAEPAVGSAPVSYTHLDVYKRQEVLQGPQFHDALLSLVQQSYTKPV